MRNTLAALLVCLFTIHYPLSTVSLAWADEPDTAVLKAEIRALKARLAQLEAKMDKIEEAPAAYQAPAIGEKPVPGLLQLPSGIAGLKLSGYADISYLYNFNEQSNLGNSGRVFDTEGNGFTPHAFELVLEKPAGDDPPFGFRADLFTGDDAEVFGASGLGSATDEIELQQAYITARAPVGNGIDFKIGKFVTLLGAEVIESPANWNFSRSYMFGYSIPFTHVGLLTTYPWNEWLSTTFGVVNGWDVVDDTNKAKTMIGNITLGPWEGLTVSVNPIFGAERAGDNTDKRGVVSTVLSWTPPMFDKLSLMFNWDYGQEEDVLGDTDNAHWQGYAWYAKYDLTDRCSLASRFEIFNDDDGQRVAPVGRAALAGSGHGDVRFWEWTLTGAHKFTEHVIGRLEYRLDKADADVFNQDRGAADYINTVAAELIYHF